MRSLAAPDQRDITAALAWIRQPHFEADKRIGWGLAKEIELAGLAFGIDFL